MSTHSAHTAPVAGTSHYYVPQPSHYPVTLSSALFLLALGFILKINHFAPGPWFMLAGASLILYVLFGWFGTIIRESVTHAYGQWEDRSFRHGMVWFIASEVAFFAAFFGALFYVRNISVPDLLNLLPNHGWTLYPDYQGLNWPHSGAGPKAIEFTPMGAWGIPALNTALLLSSGVTITWAHWGLLKNNRFQLNLGLFLTVALGFTFLGFQAWEYHHAYSELGLTLGAGVYGATFFMLTGFHGFHVTLGAIMLTVIFFRCLNGHFDAENHFAFEGVAWYWHFVDVVWLMLFVFVYWL
jgi:cytochrome c oxidase subunit 3